MEISISEGLGHVAVREDYDMMECSAYNSRIMATDSNEVTTETNTIVFVQLFESGDLRFGGEPCAIVASDSVDEDKLSPYQPSEHIRKDISGGVVMTASRQKKLVTVEEDGEATPDDNEIVVTMRRAGYLKIHRPEFPIWPLAQQELEGGIGDWGKVMIKTMRELLDALTRRDRGPSVKLNCSIVLLNRCIRQWKKDFRRAGVAHNALALSYSLVGEPVASRRQNKLSTHQMR